MNQWIQHTGRYSASNLYTAHTKRRKKISFRKAYFITPDEDTMILFTHYGMGYRYFNDTLICFIQSKPFNLPAPDPKVPFINITGNIRVRFLLQNASDFFNKTYVTPAGNKKIYQFSNKISNIIGGTLFLTAPVENYITAKDYDTGTIVQDGGNLFATLKSVKAADNIAITNTSFWAQLEPVEQVVNNGDLQDASTVDTDKSCFAVIDMYNSGMTNSSYNLFDVSEKLFNPPPSFTIKFKSKF